MSKEKREKEKERQRLRQELNQYKANLERVSNSKPIIKEFWQQKIDENERALATLDGRVYHERN